MSTLLTSPAGAAIWAEVPTLSNPAPVRRPHAVAARARILYVEDDPQLRRLGQLVLARSGYEVDTAADGTEGWAALQLAAYHLLVTDHNMPGISGLELAGHARRAGLGLPILLTSGSPGLKFEPAWNTLDHVTFLPKPFAPGLLLETVEQALVAADTGRPGLAPAPVWSSAFAARHGTCQPSPHGGINE